MADDAALFRTRADAEHSAAQAATLDNVRQRCTRAARAWEEMADRAERTTTQRLAREAATAAKVGALHDAAALDEADALDDD